MVNLYVFGNEHLECDSMARNVANFLSESYAFDVNVVHCRSPEELLESGDERLLILDVVKDTKHVAIIEDITKIRPRNPVSMHDFDLGFFLKLMKELNMERHIKIIGVPSEGDIRKISQEVISWIRKEA